MSMHDHAVESTALSGTDNEGRRIAGAWRSKWVFGGFAAIVLLMLAVEYRAQAADWLPWIFLAACPLMHLFMHRGHGNHGDDSDSMTSGAK